MGWGSREGMSPSAQEGPLFHISRETHQAIGQKYRAINGLIFLTHSSWVCTFLDNIVVQGP